ncbi:energy transducer TonB [Flavobacterium sp. 245]|uniref:energy transducer TonB n=1 Tax=Flavobacterium sp. 245 TaxID=2512115 RepID=UPI00105B55C3|nr:energy transducer TonB [Flavobacterium sp. 245]TDP00167.1 TonB-like protein [Flavobacterium sp. 245]
MKLKLVLITAFILSISSCKNETKEDNLKSEPLKTEKETILEDTIKSDSATINPSKNNLVENQKLLLDFFTKNDKKPQFFLINNQKDTTIVCAEKTKITIKSNSFVSLKTGNEVTGKIKIAVKEYYSISDMILGGLSTTSNGKLLETGGMLHITATSNNEKCDLKKGKNIEIAFPKKSNKDGMQLFNGNWQKDQINWTVDKNSVDLAQTFTNVDERPVYIGGNDALYKFIGNNYRNSDEEISGKIYASFVVNREGNVTNIKITKGLSRKADEEYLRVLRKLGKFTPGKVKGVPVNFTYSIPITIKSEDGNITTSRNYTNNRSSEPYVTKTDENIKADEISYYMFNSTKLGYLNCDRFLSYIPSMVLNYGVIVEDESNVSMNIIYHSFKSIMKGELSPKKVVFYNSLLKEKITIVAIKYFEGKLFLAIKETTTSEKSARDLQFNPVTPEELKNEIIKLNK